MGGCSCHPHRPYRCVLIPPYCLFLPSPCSALPASPIYKVTAFAGREPVLAAYSHSVQHRYRFFGYGDCMFIS
ncbi:MAG: S-adenosylmethionine:tRNA ribosyltransferase-isomerase [Terracidiphilus sp.]